MGFLAPFANSVDSSLSTAYSLVVKHEQFSMNGLPGMAEGQ